MTVEETKLINLKNKIIGLNGVKRDDVVDLENILNSNVITKDISIERFTVEESKQHYNMVLSAINSALHHKVKETHTLVELLYLTHDFQDDYLVGLEDRLLKILSKENVINTNYLYLKVFVKIDDKEELVCVEDLNLLDLIFNRADIGSDLFGDERYNRMRGLLEVNENYEEDDIDFRALPWLLYLHNNKDKFIYKEGKKSTFDITSDIFAYRLGFKVKDLYTFLCNLDSIIGIIRMLRDKIKYYEKYENINLLTVNDNELYHIIKTMKELLIKDELSDQIIAAL